MSKGIHDGHRNRMRERFWVSGFNAFQPHEILEMLLFYAIPRRNTSEIAHRLMNHFGSLSAVLDAPMQELVRIEGISRNAATLITMIAPLFREYTNDKFPKKPQLLTTTERLKNVILPLLDNLPNEAVALVCMDGKFKHLDSSIIAHGSVSAVDINTRLILQRALLFNASVVVLAHNHPSGLPNPSHADVAATLKINHALSMAEIRIWDHIIVGENKVVSMRSLPDCTYLFD